VRILLTIAFLYFTALGYAQEIERQVVGTTTTIVQLHIIITPRLVVAQDNVDLNFRFRI
jgi:hypothetical protein